MAKAQHGDSDVQAYHTAITRLVLGDLPIPGTSTTLLCDTSTGVARPIVPLAWRRVFFDTIHGLAHPGIRTSRKLVAARFVWHGMNKQVGIWAKNMCALPKIEGSPACHSSTAAWTPSRSSLPTDSCRHCWTTAHFPRKIIFVHNY